MFCNEEWEVVGVIDFTTIDEAKIKAERGYSGISKKWMESPYDDETINDFIRNEYEVDPGAKWWSTICSFCGQQDLEVEQILVGKYACICQNCVIEF